MPNLIPKEYNIVVLHDRNKNRCNGVAFYYKGPINEWSEAVESKRAMLPNGKQASMCDIMYCGSCQKPLSKPLIESVTLCKRD